MIRYPNKLAIVLGSISVAILLFIGYTRVFIPVMEERSPKELDYYHPDGSVDWQTTHIMNHHLGDRHKALYEVVQERDWVNDQNNQKIGPIIESLMFIAEYDEEQATGLAEMPFLETLEESDVHAAQTLVDLFYWENKSFEKAMRHPTAEDGITNEEAKLISLLAGLHETNPTLVKRILDLSSDDVVERRINLPLAGEVTLAIVRAGEGESTATMDLLESAVKNTESLMEVPFPNSQITLLFEETVPEDYVGVHVGNFIAILPHYEQHESELAQVITHEVAHYYWRNGHSWLDEGAADFISTYSQHTLPSRHLDPSNDPCKAGLNLQDLEREEWSGSEENFYCNYAQGERLFIDLYNTLGDETFRQGLQKLYHLSKRAYEQGAGPAGQWEMRQAFANEGQSSGNKDNSNANQIIDRWYLGRKPDTTGPLSP